MAVIGGLRGRPSKPSSRPSKDAPHKPSLSFASTKKDKQRIRHSQFVSKIAKSSAPSKKPQRRRPKKQLVTGLEELVGALPDDAGQHENPEHMLAPKLQSQVQIIKQKSQSTRPGALKRKENLEKVERERFTKNMAQMAVTPNQQEAEMSAMNARTNSKTQSSASAASSAQKFAALRGFISRTMERRPGGNNAIS